MTYSTRTHAARRHPAVSFLPFPPPLRGCNIYLFLCMRHPRQSKTDSGGFKLVRREQILLSSLMVQLSTGWGFFWVSALFESRLSKGSSGNITAQTARARSLLREGRHCSRCSALSSLSIGEALHDSSNAATPLSLRRRVLAFLFQHNVLTVAHPLKLTKNQPGNGREKQLDCMIT